MIPVAMQAEPLNFDVNVRQPGNSFLSLCPTPRGKDWDKHMYWQNCQDDLYRAYQGICAYTCEYIPKTTAKGSVDHFYPKSRHPNLAYEWSNYRLTSQKANSNKSNHVGLADPFVITCGWFTLEFPDCMIRSGDGLSSSDKALAQTTIDILKLNKDDLYVQSRCDVILMYINRDISLNYLWRYRPFIATEIHRQMLSIDDLKVLFKVN